MGPRLAGGTHNTKIHIKNITQVSHLYTPLHQGQHTVIQNYIVKINSTSNLFNQVFNIVLLIQYKFII